MSRTSVVLALMGALYTAPAWAAEHPNVLIVVIDDAGYSDLGAYGGHAHTPVIDALAARGTRLARFYATPQCGPSRAMLLTGSDNHDVGIGTINEALSPELRELPGYRMALDPDSLTLAERLRDAGYYTVATGKWGIGKPGSSLPPDHGFDRSHVLDASGADNWEQKPYIPHYETAPWFEDGEAITLPEAFYSSEYIVDRTIELLDDAPADQPFFVHLGFQAVHLPVQAPREYTERYDGVFDAGWDQLRTERAERTHALDLVPEAPIAAMPDNARAWEALSEAEQRRYTAMMQVNAGMLEAMDTHLGRLLDHLGQSGQLQDTLIVVLSDNGPESGELPAEHQPIRGPLQGPLLERLGERGTTASIGPEWATVSAAPFSLFKFHSSEGGLRVPLVIAGPGVPATPVVHARAHITDIVPTVLDLAGVAVEPPHPSAPPLRGRSLRPALLGEVDEVYGPQDPVGVEVAGNAALFRGPYKLVKLTRPHGDATWRLYDVTVDPGETRDLTDERPELAAQMRAEYEAFATDVGVAEQDADYNPFRQIVINGARAWLGRSGWLFAVMGLFVVSAGLWLRRRRA